jgi:hypothetical protein
VSAGLCEPCHDILTTTAEHRDQDTHAERTLIPLALHAADMHGGPLTVRGLETMPHRFVVRGHHDIDRAPTGDAGDACSPEPWAHRYTGHPTPWARWEISDDQDSTYTGCDLGAHASPDGWWGELHFHPRLDPRAQTVDLHLIAAESHCEPPSMPFGDRAAAPSKRCRGRRARRRELTAETAPPSCGAGSALRLGSPVADLVAVVADGGRARTPRLVADHLRLGVGRLPIPTLAQPTTTPVHPANAGRPR